MDVRKNERRARAKARLETQLKKGTKPSLITTENGSAVWQAIPLSESDVKRIKREIEIINSKI